MDFTRRMHIRRKEMEFTLKDIAKRIGVEEATVQRWESGVILIPLDKLERLAEILDISPAVLVGWVDDPDIFPGRQAPSYPKRQSFSHLRNNYLELDQSGRNKLVEYSDDLVLSGRYKNK